MSPHCPFKIGDRVIYQPSQRGWDLEDGDRLVPGQAYVVGSVQDEDYIVVENYAHPGGGLYWTEFISADEGLK